jgi:hypothetical protein
MKGKFILFIAALMMMSVGCEEEEETTVSGDACLEEVESLSNVMLDRLNAFNTNPSSSTCSAYKTSWFNVYNKMKSCGFSTTELDAVKEVVEDMDCSSLD